ncbi:MAG: hypothetical protein ACXVFM_05365, partial [Solirubrobacteraceae bacterium]
SRPTDSAITRIASCGSMKQSGIYCSLALEDITRTGTVGAPSDGKVRFAGGFPQDGWFRGRQASAAVVESAVGLRRRPARAVAAYGSALLGAALATLAQDRGDPGAIGHAAGPDRTGEDDLLLDQLAHLGLSHLVPPTRGRYRLEDAREARCFQ